MNQKQKVGEMRKNSKGKCPVKMKIMTVKEILRKTSDKKMEMADVFLEKNIQ